MIPYFTLSEIIDKISEPNKTALAKAYSNHAELIAKAPGSKTKHQAWKGGYLDHVVYATNYAFALHDLNQKLGYTPDHNKSDIGLVLLLHDFGKIAKYQKTEEGWDYVPNANDVEKAFLKKTLQDFSFQLTPLHENALTFIHGEGSSYTPKGRLMLPLATLCHQADIWNARFSPKHPLPHGKYPLEGAFRHLEIDDLVVNLKRLYHFKTTQKVYIL